MNILESVLIALNSIRENKLRSFLILLSISIGVFAIFGAGTFVSAIDNTVENELSELGENTFQVKRMPSIQFGRMTMRKYWKRPKLDYRQVEELKRRVNLTPFISSSAEDGGNVVKSRYISTDPDVTIVGADDVYFINYNYNLQEGRALSSADIQYKRNVCVIGTDVIKKTFPNDQVIGETITIKNQQFEIVGILEEKGAVLGNSQDNRVIIPINLYLKSFSSRWMSLNITLKALNKELLDKTIDQTIGAMRVIHNLKPWEENDFELETNDTVSEQFSGLTSFLTIFGILIGTFTLIAAGIGITNIMLITVKERTREIGVRMAVGAKRKWIMLQFIIETITICQVGGIIGILFGFAAIALLTQLAGLTLVIPYDWIIYSISIATILGILSGYYPAYKASKLDPIDALRYE